MSTLITRRSLSVSPVDPAVTVDSSPPVPSQDGSVVGRALEHVVATDVGVIYVSAAQDLASIHVTIEIWDHTPDPAHGDDWHAFPTLPIQWPTRDIVVNDSVDPATRDGEIQLPDAGHYQVSISHRGRERAAELNHQLTQRLPALSLDEILQESRRYNDLEHYLIRMWPDVSH